MGLMDKVKAQATQLASQAQQGMQQGQTKLNEMQGHRQADALLRDLGAAVYAVQRQGGAHEPIEAALAALDAHAAQHGPIDTRPTATAASTMPGQPAGGAAEPSAAGPSAAGPSAAAPNAAPPAPGTATAGDFSLDDL